MADFDTAPDSANGAPATPAQAPALTTVEDLKNQAAQAAETAKSSLNALASEARGKVTEIVDHQKEAGATQLSGFAKAAHTAADDLESSSPVVSRLVHDAAATVDQFAGNLRRSDVGDVLASVSSFARQQPVAFFAASVLAGFVVARFLKSDADARPSGSMTARQPASGEGFASWSSVHPDRPAL